MYNCFMYSKDLVKGMLQPIILKLLQKNGRMYGYEITKTVKELSQGRIELTEGALYPTLHKLEAEGILKTEKEYIGKRVRKYYSLTNTGTFIVTERVNETNDFLQTIANILQSKTAVS